MRRLLTALGALGLLAALPGLARAQQASVTFPTFMGDETCYQGYIYTFSSGTFPTRQGAPLPRDVPNSGTGYSYLFGGSPCGGGTGGRYDHATNPLTDGPNSLQFASARVALDLSSIDTEGADRFTTDDTDTVGGAATYYDAPGVSGERLDGQYEKNWRPFEGSRTRAVVTVPVTAIVENSGEVAGTALASGGFEVPVQPNWSLTPRVGVGVATGSKFFGEAGVLGTVSLSSRYRFTQVGRGDLVLGDMVSYTGDTAYGLNSVIFRNGVAYQWPLKHMMFGRQVSARVSYVNTYIAGDGIGVDDYHELAINFGVRMREQDVRSKFELLRFGLLYTHADVYDAVTATVGYRF